MELPYVKTSAMLLSWKDVVTAVFVTDNFIIMINEGTAVGRALQFVPKARFPPGFFMRQNRRCSA